MFYLKFKSMISSSEQHVRHSFFLHKIFDPMVTTDVSDREIICSFVYCFVSLHGSDLDFGSVQVDE